MRQENEGAPFFSDAKREAVLRGAIAGYYEGKAALIRQNVVLPGRQ